MEWVFPVSGQAEGEVGLGEHIELFHGKRGFPVSVTDVGASQPKGLGAAS